MNGATPLIKGMQSMILVFDFGVGCGLSDGLKENSELLVKNLDPETFQEWESWTLVSFSLRSVVCLRESIQYDAKCC